MNPQLTRRGLLSLAAGAGLLGLAGCGAGGASPATGGAVKVKIDHAQGSTEVPLNPSKTVVLEYSALDVMDVIGAPVTALAKDFIPTHLREKFSKDSYKSAGGAAEPDYEAINALQPQLILCGSRSAAAFKELAKIGPTVDVTTDATDYVAGARTMNRNLARIFGAEGKIDPRYVAIEQQVADIKKRSATLGRALVVLTSAGTVTAFGPGSRFGFVHKEMGFAPVDDGIKVDAHGQKIGFEYIAEKNPDWLFVIDRDSALGRGGASAAKILDNPLVNGTKAKKNNRVVTLDAAYAYLAPSGVRSLEFIVGTVHGAVGKAG